MISRPGSWFAVAPHFQLTADWPRRLLVGVGVEEVDGCFLPRGPWRSPTTDELAGLVLDPAAASTAPGAGDCVHLFRLPEHFTSAWQDLLLGQAASDGRILGFEAFAFSLAGFLSFKGLPLP